MPCPTSFPISGQLRFSQQSSYSSNSASSRGSGTSIWTRRSCGPDFKWRSGGSWFFWRESSSGTLEAELLLLGSAPQDGARRLHHLGDNFLRDRLDLLIRQGFFARLNGDGDRHRFLSRA